MLQIYNRDSPHILDLRGEDSLDPGKATLGVVPRRGLGKGFGDDLFLPQSRNKSIGVRSYEVGFGDASELGSTPPIRRCKGETRLFISLEGSPHVALTFKAFWAPAALLERVDLLPDEFAGDVGSEEAATKVGFPDGLPLN